MDHHELVLPEAFEMPQCHPGIERPVCRIGGGKATLVVYEVWRGPNGEESHIDGVLQPDNEEYEKFLNGLLVEYHKAKRASGDQRLKDTGRAARVAELFDELSHLCVARCGDEIRKLITNDDTDHEFDNLEHSRVDLEQDC